MSVTKEQLERVRRMIGRSPPWIASDADVVDLRAVLGAAEKATPPADVTEALKAWRKIHSASARFNASAHAVARAVSAWLPGELG